MQLSTPPAPQMTRGRSDAGSAAPHVGVQMLAVENTQESLLYLTLGLPATLVRVGRWRGAGSGPFHP